MAVMKWIDGFCRIVISHVDVNDAFEFVSSLSFECLVRQDAKALFNYSVISPTRGRYRAVQAGSELDAIRPLPSKPRAGTQPVRPMCHHLASFNLFVPQLLRVNGKKISCENKQKNRNNTKI